MKKRYKVTKTDARNFVLITDLTSGCLPWCMHISDFGITHKHLPKYCQTDARKLLNLPN